MATHETGTDLLHVVSDDGVATVTFNDPARHNTLSTGMRDALVGTLRALDADSDVRVVILTGAGDRAFSAGADISEFATQRTTPEARAEFDRGASLLGAVWDEMTTPVIAKIRGYCLGGGLLVALRADIRIAAAGSQFSVPAARLGLGYGPTSVTILLDRLGPAATSEILFSARRLDADEAARIGLVNRVVAADQLDATVTELARAIAANAPLTVAACKAAIRELGHEPGARNLARVDEMVEACFRSDDYREGQRAFREKRAPQFRGR